jgi:ribosomal protein S18 acetylase RimI-like enzyme
MIHIRLMTESDIPLGMRLKTAAGWNQLAADWRRVLTLQPNGCWVAEWNGAPVGTAATCLFGSVAWIAMVLVDNQYRGRGIGRALLEQTLAFLDEQQVATVRLDATPLGQPLYEKLGFSPQFVLARFEGAVVSGPRDECEFDRQYLVETPQPSDQAQIMALDREVNATDRTKLLEQLFREYPDELRFVRKDEQIAGYVTLRPGARAWQLGPCIATTDASLSLLADAVRRHQGESFYLDIPQENRAVYELAERLGLQVQRTLVRMCRGVDVREDLSRLATTSGPELG